MKQQTLEINRMQRLTAEDTHEMRTMVALGSKETGMDWKNQMYTFWNAIVFAYYTYFLS